MWEKDFAWYLVLRAKELQGTARWKALAPETQQRAAESKGAKTNSQEDSFQDKTPLRQGPIAGAGGKPQ